MLDIGLDQPTGDILRGFERLGHRPPLRHKSGQIVAGGQVATFRQGLDLHRQKEFTHKYRIEATLTMAARQGGCGPRSGGNYTLVSAFWSIVAAIQFPEAPCL